MRELKRRVDQLESSRGFPDTGRPFLWFQGQPLDAALNDAGLTLADKPLMAIRIVGVKPCARGPEADPLFERDKHLLA